MSKFTAKVSALLSAGALAVSLSPVLAGSAQAEVTPGDGWSEIWAPYLTARSNTMCLDLPGGVEVLGGHIQFFHCHGYGSDGAPQRWLFRDLGHSPLGGELVMIRNINSGLCLTAAPNGAVVQGQCGPGPTWWVLRSENLWLTDPNFSLALQSSLQEDGTGTCMAAANSTDSNGTLLVTVPCNTGTGGFQYGPAIFRLG